MAFVQFAKVHLKHHKVHLLGAPTFQKVLKARSFFGVPKRCTHVFYGNIGIASVAATSGISGITPSVMMYSVGISSGE